MMVMMISAVVPQTLASILNMEMIGEKTGEEVAEVSLLLSLSLTLFFFPLETFLFSYFCSP